MPRTRGIKSSGGLSQEETQKERYDVTYQADLSLQVMASGFYLIYGEFFAEHDSNLPSGYGSFADLKLRVLVNVEPGQFVEFRLLHQMISKPNSPLAENP